MEIKEEVFANLGSKHVTLTAIKYLILNNLDFRPYYFSLTQVLIFKCLEIKRNISRSKLIIKYR
jgi:hypothetical protein